MKKPKLFELVGWSWLIMGMLGVVLSLISLMSYSSLEGVRAQFSKPPFSELSVLTPLLDTFFRYFLPGTLVQLLGSCVMVWVSWMFLERRAWARLTLSSINWISLAGLIGFYIGMMIWVHGLFDRFRIHEFVESGMRDLPFLFNVSFSISIVLLALPLGWMAWYFHSVHVREFTNVK